MNYTKCMKKEESKKYWKAKNEQERLERTLHRNMPLFPEKQEKNIVQNLQQLINNSVVECKRQGNQLFLNPDHMKEIKEKFEMIPENIRKFHREVGKAFLIQWFEKQLKGVA